MQMDILNKSASVISVIFSPLLIPTYGLAILMAVLSRQFVLPAVTVAVIMSVVFILTGLLPYVIIRSMVKLNYVKNLDLTDRRERLVPFLAAFLLYVVAVVYLYKVNLPLWMLAFMIGGVAALAVAAIVSRRWKISAHATAVGGLSAVGLVCSLMLPGGLWLLCLTLLAAGLVMSSRLILGVHTPGQVYAGWLNGFVLVITAMFLIH